MARIPQFCDYCNKDIPLGSDFKGVKYSSDPKIYDFCSIECAQYWSNGKDSPTARMNIDDWYKEVKELEEV